MKRMPMMVGNWKMNLGPAASAVLAREIRAGAGEYASVQRVLCPAFPSLAAVSEAVADSGILVGAQNCHAADQGAFTGEVSSVMLRELVSYVIVGHSERRTFSAESDSEVNRKTAAVLEQDLIPIICVGENEAENEAGDTRSVVERQVSAALDGVPSILARKVVMAYEPVWAIGTGRAATAHHAQEVCGEIVRLQLAELYDGELAETVPVLYGGSTKPDNIEGFMEQPDVDGALIGGASLNGSDYCNMVARVA